jgi:hypothetical protein
MFKLFPIIADRLKEPSSWASISILGVLFGFETEGLAQALANTMVGLSAVLGIILKEKGNHGKNR